MNPNDTEFQPLDTDDTEGDERPVLWVENALLLARLEKNIGLPAMECLNRILADWQARQLAHLRHYGPEAPVTLLEFMASGDLPIVPADFVEMMAEHYQHELRNREQRPAIDVAQVRAELAARRRELGQPDFTPKVERID